MDFDLQKLDKNLGVSSGDASFSDEAPVLIDEDGLGSLIDLSKKNDGLNGGANKDNSLDPGAAPTPGQSPAPENTNEDIPDYLAPMKEDFSSDLVIEDKDYTKLFNEKFSESAEDGTIDMKTFEDKVISEDVRSRQLDLNYPAYNTWRSIVNKEYPEEDLVRSVVTNRLKSSGFVKQETIDEQVSAYFSDGVLNEAGKEQLRAIEESARERILNADASIESEIKKSVESRSRFMTSLEEKSKDLDIFGIKLPEEISKNMLVLARSDKAVDWLVNPKDTPEEKATKRLKLALISNDSLFHRFL